jgi:Thiolase, C-terminal domain
MARRGMPGPPQFGGQPVTNIRNVASPHWRGWLGIGATGARIMTTLTHEMRRRNVRYALETVCIGATAWTELVRPDDLVVWSQSSAEPLSLTAYYCAAASRLAAFAAARAWRRSSKRRERLERDLRSGSHVSLQKSLRPIFSISPRSHSNNRPV